MGSAIKHFQVAQQNQVINAKCESTSFKCVDEPLVFNNIDKHDKENSQNYLMVTKFAFTKYFNKIL